MNCNRQKTLTRNFARLLKAALVGLWFTGLSAYAQFTITVSSDTLMSRCGTTKIKLVFLANDSLWLIDFSEQNPKARSIKNITGAPATPVLSPDGGSVAYVTGVSDIPPFSSTAPNSIAWIRGLSADGVPVQIASPGWAPRFCLSDSSPTVLYATCGKKTSADQHLWDGCGKMRAFSVATQQNSDIWAGGSLFGGMSYNGQWLCTADNNPAYMLDITNGSNKPAMIHRLHWINNTTNADTVMELQACNPSISSSRVFFDAMMYLDIGSDGMVQYHPKNLGNWSFHTRIFISRSTNAVVRYYDAPAEPPVVLRAQKAGDVIAKQWESPRWSNHPYFASSALYLDRSWGGDKETFRNEAIYLINLKDSSYIKLVAISDTSSAGAVSLKFPWSWVETPPGYEKQEDGQWLSKSLDIAAVQPINGRQLTQSYGIHISRGRIFSNRPISTVEFLTVQGMRIVKLNALNQSTFVIPKRFLRYGPNVALCTFSDGSSRVLKMIAMNIL